MVHNADRVLGRDRDSSNDASRDRVTAARRQCRGRTRTEPYYYGCRLPRLVHPPCRFAMKTSRPSGVAPSRHRGPARRVIERLSIQPPISFPTEATACVISGSGGSVDCTLINCTRGGFVGASVILTSSQPRSHFIRQLPRSAFSGSMAPVVRQAPCVVAKVRSAPREPRPRHPEKDCRRDALSQRVVPFRDQLRDIVLRGQECW